MDVDDLLLRHEGKTLEFKRDDSGRVGIVHTAVAFSNTSGGTILIGVADRTRDIIGVDEPLSIEERVANVLSDSVIPRIVPEIEIVPWRDTQLVAVRVHPGPSRPYHVAKEGAVQGVYVRVGSTNRQADPPLIRELERVSLGRSFDEEPMPGHGTLDSIDIDAAREAYAGIREVRTRDLVTLRLAAETPGGRVPTVGGVLLFGRDRLGEFPDARIQAARFRGRDRSVIVDRLDIETHPHEAVVQALAFIRRNINVGMEIEGARRVDVWQYPPVALREAIINAVVHADYSQQGGPLRVAIFEDRLEIENPGVLVPGLTFDDLYDGVSRLRNRVIGRVFRDLGLIEQWGSGISRMVEACKDAGLRPPESREVGPRSRVTLRAGKVSSPDRDELDETILGALHKSGGLSTSEVATHIDRTSRATRARLRGLVESGYVVEVGSSANDPHRRYFVAEDPGAYGVGPSGG